jgi:hypothetical protein
MGRWGHLVAVGRLPQTGRRHELGQIDCPFRFFDGLPFEPFRAATHTERNAQYPL